MAFCPAYYPTFGDLGAPVAAAWPEKDIIKRNGRSTDTVGLALSGGGYRSAIFCYGILQGLFEIGLLRKIDYLSVVSGGSWIGTAMSMAEDLDFFFHLKADGANFIEEGFESLLVNPVRIAEELRLTGEQSNAPSNLYGKLLARTFLREHGDLSRTSPLANPKLIKDDDRPFLIANATVNFRRPKQFDVSQETFEMTRLYCGSTSLGYVGSDELIATDSAIRVRDVIAMSGAAVAKDIPGLGSEVYGVGLSRKIDNYHKKAVGDGRAVALAANLDVKDGGFYNNLGIETLVRRGCGYIIVIDAEHDPETEGGAYRQKFEALRTLIDRDHIPSPIAQAHLDALDQANVAVHRIDGEDAGIPDMLYVKLKKVDAFTSEAAKQRYNRPGFLSHAFGRGEFDFDPQFSTAKLDYSFSEHRNLSELGRFLIRQESAMFENFVSQAK